LRGAHLLIVGHRALQAEAERTGQSMSELVRLAVALYFEHARWMEEREQE
jgi:hypothetical protein